MADGTGPALGGLLSGEKALRIVPCSKLHSYGNDFIVSLASDLTGKKFSDFSRSVCHPHLGIGADGLVVVEKIEGSSIEISIFNRDGSETGMSGNGTRCACAFVHLRGWVEDPEITVRTKSGPKLYRRISREGETLTYASSIGVPGFEPERIPFSAGREVERVRDFPLEAAGQTVRVTALNVGNPQCQVYMDPLPDRECLCRLGPALEWHKAFPEGTNVGFYRVNSPHRLELKIWERGVGQTLSSGTGCSAAAVAAIETGRARSPVEVSTETGTQRIEWTPGREILLTGASQWVAECRFYWMEESGESDPSRPT